MRPPTAFRVAILLIVFAIGFALALACDLPVTAPAEAPPHNTPRPDPPSSDAFSGVAHSTAPHSQLGFEQHLELHVEQVRASDEASDARFLEAMREVGASEEMLERIRLEQEESRNRDSEGLRELLASVLPH